MIYNESQSIRDEKFTFVSNSTSFKDSCIEDNRVSEESAINPDSDAQQSMQDLNKFKKL